jgi:phosphoribosylamine--glycine ligase
MNILILGSGGREHALGWKIAKSPLVDQVLFAPGNPGMDMLGACFDVPLSDLNRIEAMVLETEPDLVVVGPEGPLAAGITDRLRARGIDVFGPTAACAKLEASKTFAKDLMRRMNVPTAKSASFSDIAPAKSYLATLPTPFVLKADGLYAGKGVVIAQTLQEAEATLEAMLGGGMGDAGRTVLIEEFMHGEEVSLFALTDGNHWVCLPAVQDHKRVGEGDTGPNTGGMGAYAPARVLTAELQARAEREIIGPVLKGLRVAGTPYQGVLYVGLMLTPDGPKVVEFNCRFGDPEAQVLMRLVEGDIVPLLLACATGGLNARDFGSLAPTIHDGAAAAVVLAAKGYPDAPEKGAIVRGLPKAEHVTGVEVFHAGTDVKDGDVIATGGRVLTVTAVGPDLAETLALAYLGVDALDAPGLFCRRDIGWRALSSPT